MEFSSAENAQSFLDTKKAHQPAWHLKCQPFVLEPWTQKVNSAKTVAHIDVVFNLLDDHEDYQSSNEQDPTVSTRHLAKNEIPSESAEKETCNREFQMDIAIPETEPKSYLLNMKEDIAPMYPIFSTEQGKVSVLGKIEQKYEMNHRRKHLEDYGKLCRERTLKSNYKHRKLQVLEHAPLPMEAEVKTTSYSKEKPEGVSVPTASSAQAKQKPKEALRERMDRDKLVDILFGLFEEQSNWTFKKLVAKTAQPQAFLKSILRDIAVYNQMGKTAGTYELKPEYKRNPADDRVIRDKRMFISE